MERERPQKNFALVWSWGIGGWSFSSVDDALKFVKKHPNLHYQQDIKIAKRISGDRFEIVYPES